ncbi:MAG: S8 family peptidase [Dermatophilaceae bacterium]
MTETSEAPPEHPAFSLKDGRYAYHDNDLVVALPHLELLRAELQQHGFAVDHHRVRRSDLLGLALVPLTGTGDAVRRIVDRARHVEAPTRSRSAGPLAPDSQLDQVLWSLRQIFAARYAGWTPSLGKNRLVGRVHGVGEVSHGGADDPEPAAPPQPAARSQGPGVGVRVGVLDTGLYPQPWLAGGWVARFSDVERGEAHEYAEGHATFVTGCILSQAPSATVEVRRVLSADGTAQSWDVAEEIVRFGRDLDVLNLSFVCYTEDAEAPLVLAAALDRLDPDLVVVAAAGNHGTAGLPGLPASHGSPAKPAWPAALERVIAVGAAHTGGERADFSPAAPWVDVLAPGVKLRSTYPSATIARESFSGWATWSGTSFSAALVSGAIASATDPGRVTSRSAAADIMQSATTSAVPVQPTSEPQTPFLTVTGL